MGALAIPKLTVAEYLAAEELAETPSEYVDGEVFQIEAASGNHGRLMFRVIGSLSARLVGSPCEGASQAQVRVSAARYLFPDIIIVCGQPAIAAEARNAITNPKVIIEVLSPATEGYDRGKKFEFYRTLPSFEEYVLLSQDEAHVDVFTRTAEGNWLLNPYSGMEATAQLRSLNISVPLGELYAGIAFPPQ